MKIRYPFLITILFLFSCTKDYNPYYTEPPKEGVPRVVFAELMSATWCKNCPIADAALISLLHEMGASKISVVIYHPTSQGDNYGTEETNNRISGYYGEGNVFPVCYMDGLIKNYGGDDSTLGKYREAFNTRYALLSPFSLSLTGSIAEKTVTANIEAVADPIATSVTVRFILVEGNITYDHGGEMVTEYYMARDFLAEEVIEVSKGYSNSIQRQFSIDKSWKTENMGIIVFIQRDDTKEIMQSAFIGRAF
jgi:hypothetical protein